MLDDFFVRALLCGMAISLMTGPMGCFVIWRRMSYFGETLSHATLLGIALAVMMQQNLYVGIGIVLVVIVGVLAILERLENFPLDTILGVISHICLAAGIVIFSVTNYRQYGADLQNILFGEILTVSWGDVLNTAILSLLVMVGVLFCWKRFIMVTLHPEIALTSGISVFRTNIWFLLFLAGGIALSVKIIGVLLVIALLLIPATVARLFSSSPIKMALTASFIGILAVTGGLLLTFYYDTPAGPTIILAAAAILLTAVAIRKIKGLQ